MVPYIKNKAVIPIDTMGYNILVIALSRAWWREMGAWQLAVCQI